MHLVYRESEQRPVATSTYSKVKRVLVHFTFGFKRLKAETLLCGGLYHKTFLLKKALSQITRTYCITNQAIKLLSILLFHEMR